MDGQSLNLKIEDDDMDERDIHDDVLILDFLRTTMVPSTMNAKEWDRVF